VDQLTTSPELSPADLERGRRLRKMRLVASSLLVIAAIIFVVTHGHHGVWGYVNAASEAAMVGAVADWFAVTALFRHPLGLKVPHTAIIPERKDSIGRSLEDFVTDNFLTAENVQQRLATAQVPMRVGRWLAEPANARRVVTESAPALAKGIGSISDAEVGDFLGRVLLPRLAREQVSPLLGSLLEGIVRDDSHRQVVDLVVRELHDWVRDNETTVVALIGSRAPWWSPRWLDDTVGARLHVELVRWLADIRDTPDHQVRVALDDLLAKLADNLQNDPATMERAEQLKVRVLSHPSVGESLVGMWQSVKRVIVESLEDPESDLRERLVRALTDLGGRIVTDDNLRASLDRRLGEISGHIVTTYGHEISTVISQTIERWDGDEASKRIELHVGRDLQFIRINGTVVGGLVGLLIYSLAQLL
jgi:Predicted membrane protein